MPRPLIAFLIGGLGLIMAACAAATPAASAPITVTVFAAASLTEAFTALKAGFEAAHPGVTVVYNFAGSNALAQQLGQGAPADVFASANAAQMAVAIEAGRVDSGAPEQFVRNRLVVVLPADNPGAVAALPDLARPGLKIVLAAKEVPVGQYTLDFLAKAAEDAAFGPAYTDAVLANVVSYEENVRSVLTKIALGEGDAGIVYTSDINGAAAAQVTRLDIPDVFNTIAHYPIAPIKDSAHPEAARAFVAYVRSAEGQATLAGYGFIPVTP